MRASRNDSPVGGTIMMTIMMMITVTEETEINVFWWRRGEPRPRWNPRF
jgi:hypothetical protein